MMADAEKYSGWIKSYAATRSVLGMCATASKEMAHYFPELRVARGWVNVLGHWVEHWWCVAPDGAVVDPTVAQYVQGVCEYKEFKSGDRVKVGRCMNCGDGIFAPVESLDASVPREVLPHGTSCCSSECASELDVHYNGRLKQGKGGQ